MAILLDPQGRASAVWSVARADLLQALAARDRDAGAAEPDDLDPQPIEQLLAARLDLRLRGAATSLKIKSVERVPLDKFGRASEAPQEELITFCEILLEIEPVGGGTTAGGEEPAAAPAELAASYDFGGGEAGHRDPDVFVLVIDELSGSQENYHLSPIRPRFEHSVPPRQQPPGDAAPPPPAPREVPPANLPPAAQEPAPPPPQGLSAWTIAAIPLALVTAIMVRAWHRRPGRG